MKEESQGNTMKPKKTPPNPNRYQTVIITLDDGSVHTFVGKVMAEKDDTRRIADIQLSVATKLPKFATFAPSTHKRT